MQRRHFLQATATALSAGLAAPFASASPLLNQHRLLLGFPPGGATDVAARWITEGLAGKFAKTAIVENRPGAAGRLAIDAVKASPADGSVMLIAPSSTVALYPHIYANLSYNPFKDLAPVSHVCEFVHGLAVGPMVPAEVKTLAQFMDWCKAHPKLASCAIPGEGSSPHFLVDMLARETGVKLEPIAYKGTGPAINDVVGGQIPAIFVVAEGAYLNFQKEGKIRVLATTGAERSAFFPQVPTFQEQGVRSIVFKEWFGLFMPGQTPLEVRRRASAAVAEVLRRPEIIQRFEGFAMTASPSSPERLQQLLQRDYDFWGPVVKRTGFNPIAV